MTTVSVYADEELVEKFDDRVWELKQEGEIDRDASRSEIICRLMEEFAEGNGISPDAALVAAD